MNGNVPTDTRIAELVGIGWFADPNPPESSPHTALFSWMREHDARVAAAALRSLASKPIPRDVLTHGLRDWLRACADQIDKSC